MKKNIYKLSYLMALLVIAFLLITGCKQFEDDLVNITDPANPELTKSVNTKEAAISLVNGCYTALAHNYEIAWWCNFTMVQEARSDDAQITNNGAGWENMGSYMQYTNIASMGLTARWWNNCYKAIRRANSSLEQIDRITDKTMTTELRDRLKGEAYFLRGLSYFWLVRDFGEEIPLIIKEQKSIEDAKVPPAAIGEVWAQIVSDFKNAQNLLPKNAEYSGNDVGRATKGSATGMLGRAYLYQQKYQEALTEFEKVIKQEVGTYTLVSNFRDNVMLDTENNAESLFEFQYSGGYGASGSNNTFFFALAQNASVGGWNNIVPTQSLINEFLADGADPRFHMTFYAPNGAYFLNGTDTLTYEDDGFYTFRKYNQDIMPPTWGRIEGTNLRLLRYSDVLLMAAECYVGLNQNIAKAKEYISQVRSRANNKINTQKQLFFSTGYNGAMPAGYPIETNVDTWMASKGWDMKKVIMHERRIELAFEQLRYYDLQRWHKAGWINIKDYIKQPAFLMGKNNLFPIPELELSANPLMKGNSAN